MEMLFFSFSIFDISKFCCTFAAYFCEYVKECVIYHAWWR